jgi:hypothetical protein
LLGGKEIARIHRARAPRSRRTRVHILTTLQVPNCVLFTCISYEFRFVFTTSVVLSFVLAVALTILRRVTVGTAEMVANSRRDRTKNVAGFASKKCSFIRFLKRITQFFFRIETITAGISFIYKP